MGTALEPFEFHATLNHLEEGLDTLHESVQRLRESTGRGPEDRGLMLFELALAEIGANVLTHGRPDGSDNPIEYDLKLEGDSALASFVDRGPPVHNLHRAMPPPSSETGRGLAIARSLLDELGYQRDGDFNKWRLVKRL